MFRELLESISGFCFSYFPRFQTIDMFRQNEAWVNPEDLVVGEHYELIVARFFNLFGTPMRTSFTYMGVIEITEKEWLEE